jgi:hypothetical protein
METSEKKGVAAGYFSISVLLIKGKRAGASSV